MSQPRPEQRSAGAALAICAASRRRRQLDAQAPSAQAKRSAQASKRLALKHHAADSGATRHAGKALNKKKAQLASAELSLEKYHQPAT
jgi:hypothetical protein